MVTPMNVDVQQTIKSSVSDGLKLQDFKFRENISVYLHVYAKIENNIYEE